MLQIISNSNETSTGPELVQNGNFSELGADVVKNGDFAQIGSELVTNGDFSAVPLTGGELVTDGNFPSPNVNWGLLHFTISSNKLHCISDGTYSYAYQNSVFEVGKTYLITFDITDWTLGTIRVRPSTNVPYQTASANGSYSFLYIADHHQLIIEREASACDMYLSNISVKEAVNLVTNPNFSATGTDLVVDGDFPPTTTAWNLFNATLESGGVRIVNPLVGDNAYITQVISGSPLGKSFVLTYDVIATNGNLLAIEQATEIALDTSTTGTNRKLYFTWDRTSSDQLVIKRKPANLVDITIDNVRLEELGGDWSPNNTGSGSISFVENGMRILTEAAPNEAYCRQYSVMDIGKSYKFTYTVSANSSAVGSGFYLYNNTGGGVQVSFADLPQDVGTHTVYFVALDTLLFFNRYGDNADITLTNIIVQELGEGWTFNGVDATNTISIESGGARVISVGTNISLRQTILEVGKSYKLTCDTTITTGALGLDATSTGTTITLAEGANELYFTATSTIFSIKRILGADNVLIDNISVKEVGQDWTLGTGWGMGENKAIYDGSAAGYSWINQNIGSVLNNSYKITFDAVVTSGSFQFKMGSVDADASGENVTVSSTNSYEVFLKSGGSSGTGIYAVANAAGFLGSITNITVQQLDPNGYWTLGTGWSIGDLKALCDGTQISTSSLYQSILQQYKSYNLTFSVIAVTDGGVGVQNLTKHTAVGTYTNDYTLTSADTNLYINADSDFIGSVSSISAKLLGSYSDQSIYVTAADVQTIAQASVYYLVELTSMGSKNSLYFLPSSVVANNGRYTKLNFTVVSKDATPTPASGIISFYDSVGGFDTYPMGFYEFRIYEQTSSTNLDPLLATGLLEKGFAFVRDFSGNMQELTDGFKEYDPTLTQYVYSK